MNGWQGQQQQFCVGSRRMGQCSGGNRQRDQREPLDFVVLAVVSAVHD